MAEALAAYYGVYLTRLNNFASQGFALKALPGPEGPQTVDFAVTVTVTVTVTVLQPLQSSFLWPCTVKIDQNALKPTQNSLTCPRIPPKCATKALVKSWKNLFMNLTKCGGFAVSTATSGFFFIALYGQN